MGRIDIRGLSRSFGATNAVESIDLAIDDGDFLVLLGPSGCGKTTLLRMIAGLLEPTTGRILIDDVDVTELPSKRRDLAMVFQSYALYPHLSVAKNLGFPLRVRRTPKAQIDARVTDVAEMLEIGHLLDRKPKQLSGGQRQRVAVGRALVRRPSAYLMDEPLSNLDAKLRTATRQELTALHRRLGATFVYVTHDQVEAMTMATRIVVLNHGRIEQIGSPDEMYDRPASVFVAGFLGSPAMNLIPARITTESGMIAVVADGIRGTLWAGQTPELAVTLGIRPEHLVITRDVTAGPGIAAAAEVVLVENLGSEQLVTCRIRDTRMTARTSRSIPYAVGDLVTLHSAVDHLHLFETDSGVRLEWRDDLTRDADETVDDLARV